MTTDLPVPDHARNMKLIGWSDMGGRADGVQLMLNKGYAITGHMFSKGFSVIDVRDPRRPQAVNYVPAPENTWNIHLQTFEDLLLVINAKDMFAASAFKDEHAYYAGTFGEAAATSGVKVRDWTAGMSVYDIKDPAHPRKIGFMPVEGGGVHRIWYTGGRWAYASALLDGFTDYIFITIDMADPAHPVEAGRWWIPGMNTAAGETPSWNPERRYGLHHPIIHGDTAYCSWRDASMVILDVADRTAPKLLNHVQWSPPFGGGTHNCLPLPKRELLCVADEAVLDHQEDGVKHIWLFDNRVRGHPISISTFPQPPVSEADYKAKGGHFGPHNIYENRPDGLVSEDLIFATLQNAGIRVYDIHDPYRPEEVGVFVPPEPRTLMDHRPNRPKVTQTCDVNVDRNGLVFANDYNGGLYVLEFEG